MLHWPVQIGHIRKSLPDDLEVDLYDGKAWLSVVGFKLTNLRISPIRWIPWPDFWEINLRTYVKDRSGNKGIWFYSLDSSDPFAVCGARLLYGLAYNFAQTSGQRDKNNISFSSVRKFPHKEARSEFGALLSDSLTKTDFAKTDLDNFLLERYCFWSRRRTMKFSDYAFVRHEPYLAVRAVKSYYKGELFESQGLVEPQKEPYLAHYCEGFDVQASAPSWLSSMAGATEGPT